MRGDRVCVRRGAALCRVVQCRAFACGVAESKQGEWGCDGEAEASTRSGEMLGLGACDVQSQMCALSGTVLVAPASEGADGRGSDDCTGCGVRGRGSAGSPRRQSGAGKRELRGDALSASGGQRRREGDALQAQRLRKGIQFGDVIRLMTDDAAHDERVGF